MANTGAAINKDKILTNIRDEEAALLQLLKLIKPLLKKKNNVKVRAIELLVKSISQLSDNGKVAVDREQISKFITLLHEFALIVGWSKLYLLSKLCLILLKYMTHKQHNLAVEALIKLLLDFSRNKSLNFNVKLNQLLWILNMFEMLKSSQFNRGAYQIQSKL